MNANSMNYPLTLPHILERAGRLYPKVEIVSRMPDKSVHRTTYGDFYRTVARVHWPKRCNERAYAVVTAWER